MPTLEEEISRRRTFAILLPGKADAVSGSPSDQTSSDELNLSCGKILAAPKCLDAPLGAGSMMAR